MTDQFDDSNYSNINDPLANVAEISPNKRYIRFEVVLPRLSSNNRNIQSSYKAFDTKNGIEVAWHKINLNTLKDSEQTGVIQSVQTVKDIQNHYITEFLSQWFDKASRTLNIITTDLSTLKEFIDTVRITLRWKIVKKWCRQVLQGLDSLHSFQPPVVHRNLSCDHIFIDSGLGETKIGDLWLASVIDDGNPLNLGVLVADSIVFTSPEVLSKQSMSVKADIYSFGLLVIEMITREEPYQECSKMSSTQLKHHILAGNLPLSMQRITNPLAKEFIQLCLGPEESRPTAQTLLNHEFLNNLGELDDVVVELGPILENHIDIVVPDPSLLSPEASKKETSNESSDIMSSIVTSLIPENIPIEVTERNRANIKAGIIENHLMTQLGQSENVHNDKGIHDGRRYGEEELSVSMTRGQSHRNFVLKSRSSEQLTPVTSQDNTKNSSVPNNETKVKQDNAPSTVEVSRGNPNSVTSSITADKLDQVRHIELATSNHSKISCTMVSVHTNKLQLMMTIPAIYTSVRKSEDEIFQIEFEYDIDTDNCEKVALEMIYELNLISTVQDISCIMQEQVDRVRGNHLDSESPRISSADVHQNKQSGLNDANTLAMMDDSSKHTRFENGIHRTISSEKIDSGCNQETTTTQPNSTIIETTNQTENDSSFKASDNKVNAMVAEIDGEATAKKEKEESISNNLTSLPSMEESSSSDSDNLLHVTNSSATPNKIGQEIAVNEIVEVSKDTDMAAAAVTKESDSLLLEDKSHIRPEDIEREQRRLSANFDISTQMTNAPNTSQIFASGNLERLDADDIRDSIDKLEKEARIARRTFQNRIQKHESILEGCEEELEEIKLQHEQKMAEFLKKEELSKAKRDEELFKAKVEFNEKVQRLRDDLRHKKALRYQEYLAARHYHHQSYLNGNHPSTFIPNNISQSFVSVPTVQSSSNINIAPIYQQQPYTHQQINSMNSIPGNLMESMPLNYIPIVRNDTSNYSVGYAVPIQPNTANGMPMIHQNAPILTNPSSSSIPTNIQSNPIPSGSILVPNITQPFPVNGSTRPVSCGSRQYPEVSSMTGQSTPTAGTTSIFAPTSQSSLNLPVQPVIGNPNIPSGI